MDTVKRKPEDYVIEYARGVDWSAQAVYSALKKQEITVEKRLFTWREKRKEAKEVFFTGLKGIEVKKRVYGEESEIHEALYRE